MIFFKFILKKYFNYLFIFSKRTQTPANILNLNLQNNTENFIFSNQMLVGPYRVFPGRLSVILLILKIMLCL